MVQALDDEGVRKLIGRRGGGRPHPLLLFLWHTACQPCRERIADVARIGDEYRARGLEVALVSVGAADDREKVSLFLTEHRINAPAYLLDDLTDELAEEIFLRDWEVTVPAAFFYDRRGQLVTSETIIGRIGYETLKSDALKLLAG